MERLRFVTQLWMDILGLIENPDKRKFTYKILELFQAGETYIVFVDEIVQIFVFRL